MNLLTDGMAQKAVLKTTLTKKVTLGGITKAYPVYKVSLNWLFYNDKNDRIATWISQYKSVHNGQTPDITDRESYNNIIERFIVESNPDAIHKTQKNIEMVDQREPGVVLADGRIIDGNRRFTCLRRLAQTNERFGWFETVILDRDILSNAKQIKILELNIQHGEESKVDYNPIDRLVGVYNDIVLTNLLSVEEYARNTNETESEVKRRVEIAKLMVEFLEFINAPNQYFVARDMQIYFPLEELLKLIRKCRNENEAEDLKNAVFTNILMGTTGDMGRFVRNIKPIVGSEYQEEFLEEQTNIAERVVDLLAQQKTVNIAVIRDAIRSNEQVLGDLERSMDKALTKVRKNETRNRPIQLAEKATTFLEGIDVNILTKMNDSELVRLNRQLVRLLEVANQLKESL